MHDKNSTQNTKKIFQIKIGVKLILFGIFIGIMSGFLAKEYSNPEIDSLGASMAFLFIFIGIMIELFSTKKWFDP